MMKGTLEYYKDVALKEGRGIVWHRLRGQFPHMKMDKFQRLYKHILSESGIRGHSLDDYNYLNV
jgi:hypothetical protein